MRLCSYIVKNDKGLAPNPFWGYCTLAVCTPNHMGIRAKPGDWFLGATTAARDHKLVYAMEVSEILKFDDYFIDPRFEKKKPAVDGTWRQRCGDNIYYRKNEKWCQLESPYHNSESDLRKDTEHPYVFISKNFYYFGNKAYELPLNFQALIWNKQGCKCDHDPDIVKSFIKWLKDNFKPGKDGEPIDRDVKLCKSKC